MSGPTRPIPIGHGHRSQRSSPIGTNTTTTNPTTAADDSMAMISQSCPVVNGHRAVYFGPRHVPPRAPVIGSLPEPSFMLGGSDSDEMMPELVLPPPAPVDADSASTGSYRREASVVHVASSCPVDIGFFRQGSPAQPRSWIPSPRASDEFDLSKSPALAMMSAMRQARRPSFDARRMDTDDRVAQAHDRQRSYPQARSVGMGMGIGIGVVGGGGGRRISDPPYHVQPSNSFVSMSQPFFGEDQLSEEMHSQMFGMENLSLGGSASSSSSSSSLSEMPRPTMGDDMVGLPPRRPERRGSYDGGIFHFEDQ